MRIRGNAKKIGTRTWIALACLALTTSLLVGNVLYGKYVHGERREVLATSPAFYFESDYLSESGSEYILNVDTGSVSFKLKNHADLLRWSDESLTYTVTLTCLTTPPPATPATLSVSTGTLAGGMKSEVEITLTGLQNGCSYAVEAVGECGFRRTLRATFTVNQYDPFLGKNLVDQENFVILTVWTKDLEGTVEITFPDGLIPDNTWPGMDDVLSEPKSFSQAYGKLNSRTYRFFKSNSSKIFSAEEFDVRLGEVVAQTKPLS